MPSFNHGRFIEEAIESVLNFRHLDLELIVMDGGSTDGTIDILRKFDQEISWVSEPDLGQSWAINEGFRRSSGDVLCWLNSDDLFEDGALDIVHKAFSSMPDIDFVYGRGANISVDGALIGDSGVQEFTLWELIHRRNFLHQPSCFFSRSAWESHGGLSETLDFVMDWDLWIRLGSLPSLFVDQSLSKNRVYPENKTMSGGLQRLREIRKITVPRAGTQLPPVIAIYGLETVIRRLQRTGKNARLIARLSRRFETEMNDRTATGLLSHRAFSNKVRLSVYQPAEAASAVALTMTHLSSVDSTLAVEDVRFRWESGRSSGTFLLRHSDTGPQHFEVPAGPAGTFQHIELSTTSSGVCLPGGKPIVGYLDDFSLLVQPQAFAESHR